MNKHTAGPPLQWNKKKIKGKCQLQLANAEPEQKPVLVLDGLMHCGFLQIVIHIITLFFFSPDSHSLSLSRFLFSPSKQSRLYFSLNRSAQ